MRVRRVDGVLGVDARGWVLGSWLHRLGWAGWVLEVKSPWTCLALALLRVWAVGTNAGRKVVGTRRSSALCSLPHATTSPLAFDTSERGRGKIFTVGRSATTVANYSCSLHTSSQTNLAARKARPGPDASCPSCRDHRHSPPSCPSWLPVLQSSICCCSISVRYPP